MALNLVLLPDYLDREYIERIKEKYKEKNNEASIDYHVSTYPRGDLKGSFIYSKASFDINEFICIAYKEDIKKAGRAVKWLNCGLDENKVNIIELEGEKEKDDSKLENLLKQD